MTPPANPRADGRAIKHDALTFEGAWPGSRICREAVGTHWHATLQFPRRHGAAWDAASTAQAADMDSRFRFHVGLATHSPSHINPVRPAMPADPVESTGIRHCGETANRRRQSACGDTAWHSTLQPAMTLFRTPSVGTP